MGRMKDKAIDILERVPSSLAALFTVISVAIGGLGAFYTLRQQTAVHENRINTLESKGGRADSDHDILVELRGEVRAIRLMLERTSRATFDEMQTRRAYVP